MKFSQRITVSAALVWIAVAGCLAAQTPCGSDEARASLYAQFPWLEVQAQTRELQLQQAIANGAGSLAGDTTYIIPVVVHVVWNQAEENIPDIQILSQIAALNRAFRMENPGAGGANWGLVAGNANIEFSLATRDPAGNTTDGITRRATTVAGFTSFDAVKAVATGGTDPWNRDQYLNIWVCRLNIPGPNGGSVVAYAQYPGGPAATDGVVVRPTAFGSEGTAASPYQRGIVGVHEVGHWLDLLHLWDLTIPFSLCRDDYIADTPPQQGPIFGCPQNPQSCCFTDTLVNPCGSVQNPNLLQMVENYMGYADDLCKSLFTHLQVVRMRACLDPANGSAQRSILNSSPALPNACAFSSFLNMSDGSALDSNVKAGFAVATAPGRWNLVYCSSANDWDLYIGQAKSSFPGAACDFLVVNGHNGAIEETTGAVVQGLPYPPAYRAGRLHSSTLTIGSTVNSTIQQGRNAALYEFNVPAPGTYNLSVNGPGLMWDLYTPGTDARWRPRGAPFYGSAGGSNVALSLSPGWHALVVFNDIGWAPAAMPFQVCLTASCGGVTVGALPATVNATTNFGFTPGAGRWNVAGVGSATANYDLTIGPATSSYGSGYVDFAVANGHLGAVSPANGTATLVSGSGAATVQHDFAVGITTSTYFAQQVLPAGSILGIHEFNLTGANTYHVSVTGDGSLFWDLYTPGADSAWRPRGAPYYGSANSPVQTITLGSGWHCIVVMRDGGPAPSDLPYRVTVVRASGFSLAQGAAAWAGGVITLPMGGTVPAPYLVHPGCGAFTLSAQAGRWNVVAARGINGSNNDLEIGAAHPGDSDPDTVDFAVANGRLGAIGQSCGIFSYLDAYGPMLQHPSPGTLAPGTPVTAALPAGDLVALYEFQITAGGTYSIAVSGDGSLVWDIYLPGADPSWRACGAPYFGNSNGASQTMALSPGWHALVLTKDGGASATAIPYLVCLQATCSSTTLANGTSATVGSPAIGTSFVTSNPTPGLWNILGVGATTGDWNFAIGGVVSNRVGSETDFVVANGRLGTIAPTSGTATRASGTSTAVVQHRVASGFSADIGQVVEAVIPTGELFRIHEFEVTSPGTYVISVTGDQSAGVWDLYLPGTGPAWRPRGAPYWGFVDGPVQTASLGIGWHAVVLCKDGALIASSLSYRLIVVRAPGVTLSSATPAPTGSGSYGFAPGAGAVTLSPVALHWNALAIACDDGPDFDIHVGAAHSEIVNGAVVDFAVANGRIGPVAGSTGAWVRENDADSTLQHVAATAFTPGTTVPAILPAGAILALHEFEVTSPAVFSLSVSGDVALSWELYGPGTGPEWRPRGAPWSGTAGGPVGANISLGIGWHCIVIVRDCSGGNGNLPYQLDLCPVATPLPLTAGTPVTVGGAALCAPFSITPGAGAWNGVAVAGVPADWNLQIGAAQSQSTVAADTDFALANGALGMISPTTGMADRVSGAATARLQHVVAQNGSSPGSTTTSLGANQVLKLVQFAIATPGEYGLNVTGDATLRWEIHVPGASAAWRPRGSSLSGVPGGGAQNVFLAAGLHVLVVTGAGAPSASGRAFALTVTAPNPVPTLTSLNPASTLAGTASVDMYCIGTGFLPQSLIRWNGSPLTTTWLSPTQLRATLSGAMIATPGTSAVVTVFNPAPGGGESGSRTFNINNPFPAIASLFPTSASAGASALLLGVSGSGFFNGSVVRFGGVSLTTTFVSGTSLWVTVPASLIATAAVTTVTVFNPAPGGGTSLGQAFTIENPAPLLASINPASVTVGSAGFTLTCMGASLNPTTRVRWNGADLPTTFVSAIQVTAAVPSGLVAAVGTAWVALFNPAPVGGISVALPITIGHPVPVLTSISPATVTACGPGFTLSLTGSGFMPGSAVHWVSSSTEVPVTTFISSTQLTASIPAGYIASADFATIRVYNPAPGGGASGGLTLTTNNPVPLLVSLSSNCATAGSPTFVVTCTGVGFKFETDVRWNGNLLATGYSSPTQVSATVPAAFLATAGTASITLSNPAPGGGTSNALPFTVNAALGISSLSPASLVAGSGTTTLNLDGTGFLPASVVWWNGASGVPLATNYDSPTQISAVVPASYLNVAAPTQTTITVVNPPPCSGQASLQLPIPGPQILILTPPVIPLMTPVSPPVNLTLTAQNILPSSVVYANGDPLATGFGAGFLTAVLPPSVPQTQRPGGIVLTIQNAPSARNAVSESWVLEVGGDHENGAKIRRHPLNPAPGEAYGAIVEGGVPNALFSLFADTGNPYPVTGFPTPAADLVLATTPYAGSTGLLVPLVDGFGLFSPPTGATIDPYGGFYFGGFVAPNPPFGIDITVQGVYLDPTALLGFRLTWARYPDRL